MKLYDIVVVGAGPAGMIAAIRAGQFGKNVMLIERNETLGKKLKITGSSRCNITNIAPLDRFMKKFGKKGAFFRSAFAAFSNKRLISFFGFKGLKFKEETNGRIFPVSDRSRSIIKVLKEYLLESNVKINYNTRLNRIRNKGDYFSLDLGDDNYIATKKVILATGGLSYPSTGSTGDGFDIAENLGHKIMPLKPGLVPLKTSEGWVKDLQGITLEGACLTIKYGKKKIVSDTGNLIFTHFGVSGPLVLDLSNQIIQVLDKNKKVDLFIDIYPNMKNHQLQLKFIDEIKKRSKTEFKNFMKLFVPNRMINIITELTGIDPKKKVNQITKEERNKVLNYLKAFPLTINGYLPIEKAMVTCGGVLKNEINPQTMESKIVKGIFFAGEIIDFCAPSGGYNLQEAFSTGYLAGECAAKSIE